MDIDITTRKNEGLKDPIRLWVW